MIITRDNRGYKIFKLEGKTSLMVEDLKGNYSLEDNDQKPVNFIRNNGTIHNILSNRKHWAIDTLRKYWDQII